MSVQMRLLTVLMAMVAMGLSSCGAGLVGGIASSNSGGGGTEPVAPQLNFADEELPVAPRSGDIRTVVVAGAQLAGSQIEVKITAAAGEAVQPNAIAQVQGSSTIVSFELSMNGIFTLENAPTTVDLPATLSVSADGEPVGEPINITLVRRPVASLVFEDPEQTEAELSPFGERVRIAVDGLRTPDPSQLQVLVTTPDPDAGVIGATVTRLATDIAFDPKPSNVPTLFATIPGNPFPDRVRIQVLDPVAGQSTIIENAYYRPEFALALPGQGSTRGGTLLTLIGSALVPYDLSAVPAQYDFDRISLALAKGGRVTQLPPDDIRTTESALDRLVFTMPPSPDGRPGVVDIILTIQLEDHAITVTAKLFLFANPDPVFGPRGAVLAQPPIKSVPIQLDSAPLTTAAPDFALLLDQGGVGFVQLMLAQQNGMFQPFAAPIQIGNQEVERERKPRDLLVGDFDGDGVPDMFVVNEGAANGATHHVVLGQERPEPPIGNVVPVEAPVGAVQGRVAFIDDDSLPDVVLIPRAQLGGGAPVQVLLSRPNGFGQPAFLPMPNLDFGPFAYEVMEIADLNGDGAVDIAVASGSELRVTTMLGDGFGNFTTEHEVAVADMPLYGPPDDESPAVGLHSCQNGLRPSLALVIAGVEESQTSSGKVAAVAVFDQVFENGEWTLREPVVEGEPGPVVQGVFTVPEIVEPLGHSLVANIDDDSEGIVEMVLAVSGEPSVISGGLLQFDRELGGFRALTIEDTTGTEVPLQVSGLAFAAAFPGETPSSERKAVFVVHEVDVDGARERRISTRLVQLGQSPRLLPPDAGGAIPLKIDGVVAGLFTGDDVAPDRSALDLALTSFGGPEGGEIQIIDNDGFGGFAQLDERLIVRDLLPGAVALFPGSIGQSDSLVCLSNDGGVTMWFPNVSNGTADSNVRATKLAVPGVLDEQSSLQVADVDRDGLLDLVLLLSVAPAVPGSPGETLVAIMRGTPVPFGDFPFEIPTEMLSLHGNASSFTLANFTESTPALEMAVAIPEGDDPSALNGNHIVFCRYVAGVDMASSRFELSFEPGGPQNLLAGDRPVRLASSDFDGDGLSDLLVACLGDRTLRMFRNADAPGGVSNEVNVGAFEEGLGSPWELSAGVPTVLQLSDVNGDGNLDVVVATEFTGSTTRTTVASYLSTGTGDFGDARFTSTVRVGRFEEPLSLDLGDWNSDGVPDLFIGWSRQETGLANLRVLFGGTK